MPASRFGRHRGERTGGVSIGALSHREGISMHNRYLAVTTTVMSIAFAAAQPSEARVVKFVVEQRSTFVGGAAWGNVGAYEMLRGTAYLEVDPRDPRDAVIVDLENAPRNACWRGYQPLSTMAGHTRPAAIFARSLTWLVLSSCRPTKQRMECGYTPCGCP